MELRSELSVESEVGCSGVIHPLQMVSDTADENDDVQCSLFSGDCERRLWTELRFIPSNSFLSGFILQFLVCFFFFSFRKDIHFIKGLQCELGLFRSLER